MERSMDERRGGIHSEQSIYSYKLIVAFVITYFESEKVTES